MRKVMRRRALSVLAAGSIAALLLSGCAGSSNDAGEGGDDARIRVARSFAPTAGLSPYSDDATTLSKFGSAETLVQLSDDLEAEPLLATDFEQVDDLTWTFTLGSGVTFHDGTEMDAAAVKNALDHASSAASPPRALKGVKLTVEATADDKVTIKTDIPDPLLTNRLTSPQLSIFSAAAYKDDGTVDPVGTGTGPFVLKEVNGTTTATFDRYEDYWGDKAKLAGIDVSFVPDGQARASAIRADEADVADNIPVSQASLLDPDQVFQVPTVRSMYIALNTKTGAFSDPAVRAAARAAIDPSKIVKTVFEDQSEAADGLLSGAVPWAADHRGDTTSAASPAKVSGTAITLATYTDRPELPEAAVQLQKQLEDAGFTVTQDVREYASMEKEILGGAFDAVVMARNTMLDTGDPLSSFFQSDFTCEGGYNVSQFCDPKVDELVKKGLALPTGTDREKATMDVEAAVLQADAAIPLVYMSTTLADNGKFKDVVRDPREQRLITAQTAPAK